MKIAFIVNQFPTLSETFILNQIIGLKERGHDVEIFPLHDPKESKIHDIINEYNLIEKTHYPREISKNKIKYLINSLKIIKDNITNFDIYKSLNFPKYGRISYSLKLLYFVDLFSNNNFNNFDIIHAHFGPNGKIGMFLKKNSLIDGKLITSFYGHDISEYIKNQGENVYDDLIESGDKFTVLSDEMENRLMELGCDESKIEKVPLTVDIEKFKPVENENGKVKIITVARFTEKKGLEYAIRSLSNIDEGFEYHLVGDGKLRNKIEKMVGKKGLDNKVFFHGWCTSDEVRGMMQKSDIFLLPSVTASNGDKEGTPTVLLEAQSCGLPVISTYHAGIPEIVQDGKTGFLSNERDVKKLTENIRKLIINKNLRNEMGEKGRKYIEENHSIEKISKKLEKIYSK